MCFDEKIRFGAVYPAGFEVHGSYLCTYARSFVLLTIK